jgi:hypothetical protein
MKGVLALIERMLEVVHTPRRKSFTYRRYPNEQQRRLLEQQLEECRWLYLAVH